MSTNLQLELGEYLNMHYLNNVCVVKAERSNGAVYDYTSEVMENLFNNVFYADFEFEDINKYRFRVLNSDILNRTCTQDNTTVFVITKLLQVLYDDEILGYILVKQNYPIEEGFRMYKVTEHFNLFTLQLCNMYTRKYSYIRSDVSSNSKKDMLVHIDRDLRYKYMTALTNRYCSLFNVKKEQLLHLVDNTEDLFAWQIPLMFVSVCTYKGRESRDYLLNFVESKYYIKNKSKEEKEFDEGYILRYIDNNMKLPKDLIKYFKEVLYGEVCPICGSLMIQHDCIDSDDNSVNTTHEYICSNCRLSVNSLDMLSSDSFVAKKDEMGDSSMVYSGAGDVDVIFGIKGGTRFFGNEHKYSIARLHQEQLSQ